jgi:chloramphenicol 3-O-phosphotransferase
MAEVIILNGPPGVGKTMLAAELRTLVPSTVSISGDELRASAPADARAHLGGGATYRAGGVLSAAFLEMGAARVLFDYVFLRSAHFRYFREALPAAVSLHVFTLWAPLEIITERDAARPSRPRLGLGSYDSYSEMQQNMAEMGQIIDAASADPGQLARRIHELVARSAGH